MAPASSHCIMREEPSSSTRTAEMAVRRVGELGSLVRARGFETRRRSSLRRDAWTDHFVIEDTIRRGARAHRGDHRIRTSRIGADVWVLIVLEPARGLEPRTCDYESAALPTGYTGQAG